MGKRDELIGKYADQLRGDLGISPDMDLLRKVTIGCGPSIYNRDASTVAGSDPKELETVRKNFVMKKLGVTDAAKADAAIAKVMDHYKSKGVRTKYRAVVYYMLAKDLGRESIYS